MTKTFMFDEHGKLIHHKRQLKPKEEKVKVQKLPKEEKIKVQKPSRSKQTKPRPKQKYIKKKDRIHISFDAEPNYSANNTYSENDNEDDFKWLK